MRVDNKTIEALMMALNFRQMRQELITSNIANAETPGYKAKKLDFEDALARALDVDGKQNLNVNDPKHFNVGSGGVKSVRPEIYDNPNGVINEDGNTVDRDAEMAAMTENKIMYDAAVELLDKKLALQKYILNSER